MDEIEILNKLQSAQDTAFLKNMKKQIIKMKIANRRRKRKAEQEAIFNKRLDEVLQGRETWIDAIIHNNCLIITFEDGHTEIWPFNNQENER